MFLEDESLALKITLSLMHLCHGPVPSSSFTNSNIAKFLICFTLSYSKNSVICKYAFVMIRV